MIKLKSIFKSAVQYMFLTCDIIGLHDIFLSTYCISDQSEKTYCFFIKQNNLMFKIHWNVLPVFFLLGHMTWVLRAVKSRLTLATRNNFENILEYESGQRTRFKDHLSFQYVRDTLKSYVIYKPQHTSVFSLHS